MVNTPNYRPGAGLLVTDRHDFQKHVDGYNAKHNADKIVLSPSITIGTPQTNVQDAIAALSGLISAPVVPDATTSVKGIVRLGGDLNGLSSTANSPAVSGLQGRAVDTVSPSDKQVLTWDGGIAKWSPKTMPDATASVKGVVSLGGDLNGAGSASAAPIVSGLQGRSVDTAAPTSGYVLTWDGGITKWTPKAIGAAITMFGDVTGTANANVVVQLNGHPIVSTAPNANDYLTWNGSAWAPTPWNPSMETSVISVSSTPYTISSVVKNYALFIDTSSIAITIVLPVGIVGMILIFKDVGGNALANNITLQTPGSQKIEGLALDYVMDASFQNIKLMADNNLDWWIV